MVEQSAEAAKMDRMATGHSTGMERRQRWRRARSSRYAKQRETGQVAKIFVLLTISREQMDAYDGEPRTDTEETGVQEEGVRTAS